MKTKIVIIGLVIVSLLTLLLFDYLAGKSINYVAYDIENEEKFINEMYEFAPELFKFDDSGKAIIYIRNFTDEDGYTNTKYETTSRQLIFDKDLNECDGYYVVYKKSDSDKLEVDMSHICDMLDY